MNEAQIEHMTRRFLGWKIPKVWRPDNGISFEPLGYQQGPNADAHWPSGTNLFDYGQAKEMIEHMVDGMPQSSDMETLARALRKFAPDLADELVRRWQNSTNALEDLIKVLR